VVRWILALLLVTIMGVHELGNDTIDGEPIAVTW
jgi:hypothetical protein